MLWGLGGLMIGVGIGYLLGRLHAAVRFGNLWRSQ